MDVRASCPNVFIGSLLGWGNYLAFLYSEQPTFSNQRFKSSSTISYRYVSGVGSFSCDNPFRITCRSRLRSTARLLGPQERINNEHCGTSVSSGSRRTLNCWSVQRRSRRLMPVRVFTSGSYCVPGCPRRSAQGANGTCPWGWTSSGAFCMRSGR